MQTVINMDRLSDTVVRHNGVLSGVSGPRKQSGWLSVAGLFIVQFLLSQLVLSYCMYSIFLLHENVKLHDVLWSPLVLLATWKMCNPWCRDIAESLSDGYFRRTYIFGLLICVIGVTANYFSISIMFRAIFYGGFGGVGACLVLSLVQTRIFDIYQYQTTIIYCMEHLSTSLGLFFTPHLLNYLYYEFAHTKYVFLIHGALLLHALPASFLFGKPDVPKEKRFSRFSYWGSQGRQSRELENTNVTQVSRNWRCPSEKVDELFESHEDLEHETPVPHEKCTLGVEVLPEIPEENEEEADDCVHSESKRGSKLLNDINRLSVISSKLEEIIVRNENEENVQPNISTDLAINDLKSEEIMATELNPTFRDLRKNTRSSNPCCCSPYQKFRYRRRCKSCCDDMVGIIFKPLFSSMKVWEFYPCLISSIHSMLSPFIFLIFMIFKYKENNPVSDDKSLELTFMVSVTAFAYICFLITLPWVVDISKRNLRYLLIFGLMTSTIGLQLIRKNDAYDYITVSCLVYGFGYGIESYSQEIVIKEYLGVKNWSKVEGTLDFLSGVLLVAFVTTINSVFKSDVEMTKAEFMKLWFNIIFCSHILVMTIWILLPLVDFISKYKKKSRQLNRYSFMQQS